MAPAAEQVDDNDPFLTYVNTSKGKKDKAKKPAASGNSNAMGMLLLSLVPWLFFLTVSCLFAFAYHRERLLVWGCVFALAGASLMLMVLDSRNKSAGPWYLFLGLLCFVSVTSSAFCGFYNYQTHMYPYWAYEENRLYSNVLPSEPAAAHSDAGKIIFSSDARVDTTRSVGFKAGSVYCVAPIMDDTQATRVEYWAAGLECCGQRSDFSCDDAWNPDARSGVVIVDQDSLVPTHHDYFMQGVHEAEAAFDLVSAKNPIFVRWVADPQEVQDEFWRSGVGFLVAECCVFLLSSVIFGAAMQYGSARTSE